VDVVGAHAEIFEYDAIVVVDAGGAVKGDPEACSVGDLCPAVEPAAMEDRTHSTRKSFP
jgi:hypothetical protein